MNCKNCNCASCANDRARTDLKRHRLETIDSWSWNCNAREASKILLAEVAAGRGGSKLEWAREVKAMLPERDAHDVLKLIGECSNV